MLSVCFFQKILCTIFYLHVVPQAGFEHSNLRTLGKCSTKCTTETVQHCFIDKMGVHYKRFLLQTINSILKNKMTMRLFLYQFLFSIYYFHNSLSPVLQTAEFVPSDLSSVICSTKQAIGTDSQLRQGQTIIVFYYKILT